MTIPNESPAVDTTSVDDLAAKVANRLKALTDERTQVRGKREAINHRLKYLDSEIDKAERMTKALVPRTRSSKTV